MNASERIVAVDGPAGAGKSTVARSLASRLNFTYLDSGAMYRAVALAARRAGRDPADVADDIRLELAGTHVLLDGEDVSALIRSDEISQAASIAAADPRVRAALVRQQQRMMAAGGYIAEGRDIGTVVAPQAAVKVFLSADPAERARRRAAQTGEPVEQVLAQLTERDTRDSGRAASPLRPADDAIILDSTQLSQDEVVEQIALLAVQRGIA